MKTNETKVISYKLSGHKETFTYLSRFGIEDFYADLNFDGWKKEEITILEIRDATTEEIAAEEDTLASYFGKFGTACE